MAHISGQRTGHTAVRCEYDLSRAVAIRCFCSVVGDSCMNRPAQAIQGEVFKE